MYSDCVTKQPIYGFMFKPDLRIGFVVMYFIWAFVCSCACASEKKDVLNRDFDAINIGGSRFIWDSEKYGGVITSICQDLSGNIWVGTEGRGIYKLDVDARLILCMGRANQFRDQGSSGKAVPEICDDIVYSLACDKQGRIWAGHCNHGVSVFNGEDWENYSIENGPLGERIFDIKVNPETGDIWIATNLGIACYLASQEEGLSKEENRNLWVYYTKADGLPANQISSIAFSPKSDRVYIGTQCDGIAIGKINNSKSSVAWKCVNGPLDMPLFSQGEGLPSSRINDIAVADDENVYVATDCGLAVGDKKGKDWNYFRGRDLIEKAKLLYIPLHVESKAVAKKREQILKDRTRLLASDKSQFKFDEDYVTSVNIDGSGMLWLGQRFKGYAVLDPKKMETVHTIDNDIDMWGKKDKLVTDIFFPKNDLPLVAFYGKGLMQSSSGCSKKSKDRWEIAKSTKSFPKHPLPATCPTSSEISGLMEKIKSLSDVFPVGHAEYISEDWQTRGNWLGRYGRQYALLCATNSPYNHYVRWNDTCHDIYGSIGPHVLPQKDINGDDRDDALRHWLNGYRTNDSRSLFNPKTSCRRQAEWDDHGEAYDINWEGPDIWASVNIPEGFHQLAIYFINPGGQDDRNFYRNYVIEVRNRANNQSINEALCDVPVAHARVLSFYGGVYKIFLLNGPAEYWVRIRNNYSYNCQVSALMLTQLSGFRNSIKWHKNTIPIQNAGYFRPPNYRRLHDSSSELYEMDQFMQELFNGIHLGKGICDLYQYFGMMGLRIINMNYNSDDFAPTLYRWKFGVWDQYDDDVYTKRMNRLLLSMKSYN